MNDSPNLRIGTQRTLHVARATYSFEVIERLFDRLSVELETPPVLEHRLPVLAILRWNTQALRWEQAIMVEEGPASGVEAGRWALRLQNGPKGLEQRRSRRWTRHWTVELRWPRRMAHSSRYGPEPRYFSAGQPRGLGPVDPNEYRVRPDGAGAGTPVDGTY